MKLGIVYKDGHPINHRSLVKVIANPLFRYFGFCIGTKFEDGKIGGVKFIRCERSRIHWAKYGGDYDYIIKKRILL